MLGLDDVAPYDEPAETEPTFEGNALLKARAGLAATGLPSLADDSGLCVDALNGMPGRAVGALGGAARRTTPPTTRCCSSSSPTCPTSGAGAHFRCAVAFCLPDRAGGVAEHVVHGGCPAGSSARPRGSGGFGYDVLFVAEGGDRTSAELSVEEKDAISHRGKAIREIAPYVADVLTGL